MNWRTLEWQHKVRIRKQRYCQWCARTWPVGSMLWTWVTKQSLDPAPARDYMCQVCTTYYGEHWNEDDELPFEPFWVEDPEQYAEIERRMSLAIVVMEAGIDFVLPLQGMSDDRRARLIRKGKVS